MANEYLKRTPTSTGNRRVFTWSGWYKRSNFTPQTTTLFSAATSGDDQGRIAIRSAADGAGLFFQDYTSGASQLEIDTSSGMKLRDFSSWMNLIIAIDTTKTTEDNRVKLYVNGVLYAGPLTSEVYTGGINYNTRFNQTILHTISWLTAGGSGYEFLGELADLFLVDGQALTPDVFGFYKVGKGYVSAGSTQATDFRPGQWVPKTPRVIKTAINNNGGFGVNGFYLPMNDSNNFGADFHCDPNSIIKLQENLPQPRSRIDGVGDYTGALRDDPYAANLVLALPFVSGGLNSGFGDYSAAIKGSGTPNTSVLYGNTQITNVGSASSSGGYYGSSAYFDGSGDYVDTGYSINTTFGSGNYTIEFWINSWDDQNERGIFGSLANQYGISLRQYGTYGAGGNQTLSATFGQSAAGYVAGTTVRIQNQWNHIAMVKNVITGTLYLNGVAVGIATNVTAPSFTTSNLHIGTYYNSSYPFIGYIQDFRVYNTAKYKGGFDVPRPYTPVGIATWRAVPDSPANNFATLNPLVGNYTDANFFPSDGNLSITVTNNNGYRNYPSTFSPENFKGYLELRWSTGTPNGQIGITDVNKQDTNIQYTSAGTFFIYQNGNVMNGPTTVKSGCTPSFSSGDTLQIAFDFTGSNKNIWFGRNGTWGDNTVGTGNPSLGINPMFTSSDLTAEYRFYFGINTGAGTQIVNMNFGQNPSFSGNTTAGTYTDSNNKGLFKYQPPSGFLALCEDNLPTPAISDPGKHFKTVLWTGDGGSRNIVGVGFTPDLVWIKSRTNGGYYHNLVDSVRGPSRRLASNSTNAEDDASAGGATPILGSFDYDGFSLPNGNVNVNESGQNYVAWCWKAGAGTTSTNTNGSITSVVSVNQDAGFSIVSYTGPNDTSAHSFSHGLGKKPSFILIKNRDRAFNWDIYHSSLGYNSSLIFTSATTRSGAYSAEPDSALINVQWNYTTYQNDKYVAYCWAEIEGFSKAFSYVGNGSADGPMIFLGLKPALIIIKRTNDSGNWQIYDSSRMSTNPNNGVLFPNLYNVEGTGSAYDIDFLSNGFKLRSTDTDRNASGSTYVGFAWAESPFQTANSK